MRNITIALADENTLFRKGIVRMIEHSELYRVLFDVAIVEEAKNKMVAGGIPDILIMDIQMPDNDGVEMVEWVKSNHPKVKVIGLSMENDETVILNLLKAGANSYLLKTLDPGEFFDALEGVSRKDFYLPEIVSSTVINSIKTESRRLREKKIELNERERSFLLFLCQDLSYKEIAAQMFVSHRTIDEYKANLCRKFEAKTRTGLIVGAIRRGLLKV